MQTDLNRKKKRNSNKFLLYSSFLKRIIDTILSFILIVFLFPTMIIIAFLVRKKLGSPIIFKQERPGKSEVVFTMYKFRTMTDKRDENGKLTSDSDRLTKFGKVLRSTSLDELPELFNILKGDMSFVGPRPLLVQYLELYNDHQKRRHLVRPGLSGLAQVNGRNTITWEEKFDYDVKYVDNVTFLGDCKIILLTIKKVFIREGIAQEGAATMEAFTGSDEVE